MNREIKFRQPIMRNGKFHSWHYWGFISKDNFVSPSNEWVGGERSQQYTGLRDKNGKEIYDGDILKHQKYNILLEVIWNQDSCGWQAVGDQSFFLSKLCSPHVEIIGNIYQNPELLEAK